MAHWQGLAKLRMHTDTTLDILEKTTVLLGRCLREFKDKTCSQYATRELPTEASARQRRARNKSRAAHVAAGCTTQDEGAPNSADVGSNSSAPSLSTSIQEKDVSRDKPKPSRLPKSFNMNTIKFHSLGDYAPTIRVSGTADSFSTQAASNLIYLLRTAHRFYLARAHAQALEDEVPAHEWKGLQSPACVDASKTI